MDMKRFLKWFAIIFLLLFTSYTGLTIFFGDIDYGETFSTKYVKTGAKKTISTSHFEIETPKNWIHIFHGYGEEGEAIGTFLTRNGKLKYEYGLFSNPFEIDSIFVFSRDSLNANRFKVYIGHDNSKESSIYIPQQYEMEWSFSIFMSQACTDNLGDIIQGIKQMRFKKFYSLK
jgi:hypothetical protein